MHTKKPTANRKPSRKPGTRGTTRTERPETTHARIALQAPIWIGKAPNWIALRYLHANPGAEQAIATVAAADPKRRHLRPEDILESTIARLWGRV